MSLNLPSPGAHTGSVRRGHAAAALTAALLGFFVITLDALVVNVALPAIRTDLGGGITGLQWVLDGYTLIFAALLLSAGSLSDRIGARRAFGLGLAVFVAASAACGLAPSLPVLIGARLVQGAGAAAMMPTSLALIREAYSDPAKRARAVALWAVGGAVASAAGPVAGGAASLISWRMIFFINLPVGLIALLLLTRSARSPHRPVPFDMTGQVTAVIAMGALTFAAIEAGERGFTAPLVWGAAVVTLVAAAVFVRVQATRRHPMVPLGLLRERTVVISCAAGFAFMAAFYGMVFVLSLYLQQQRGLSPLATGAAFVPMTVLSAFINPLSARAAERLGPRVPIASGLLLMAAGLIALAMAPAATPTWALALLMLPVGIGGPLAMPPTTALLVSSVPQHHTGTASGVFNTSRQLGGALAVAVFGALIADQAHMLTGVRASLLLAAVVIAAAGIAACFLRPTSPHPGGPAPDHTVQGGGAEGSPTYTASGPCTVKETQS
ncbi:MULTISPECIES: MFS transporter [Streptomyces]|uniref:MFS transporter n=1 Tax=Streptomyces canarius TaxID=285453 RepID=A0ABQ3DEC0_9ACTN|nr:MFS transporter [Streptomyces canarius]GHA71257.1 MFS transporter [Streptomyces canarius]